uniref:Chromosome 15 open reading frame 48 n=1 Tax=Sphenodon punctatus TaxID=8508 RepID=A0A8D0GW27_SPHPU
MVVSGIFKTLNKHKELIPLFVPVVMAGCAGIGVSIYALFTKNDVIINKTGNPQPWDYVDPRTPQKLMTINQEWKPIEELEMVKKMMK